MPRNASVLNLPFSAQNDTEEFANETQKYVRNSYFARNNTEHFWLGTVSFVPYFELRPRVPQYLCTYYTVFRLARRSIPRLPIFRYTFDNFC